MKTKILASGMDLPSEIVATESSLQQIDSMSQFGVPHDYIATELGIKTVRYYPVGTRPSEPATEAAKNLFKTSDISPEEIDTIIFCGITKDYSEPSTAHVVQSNLGITANTCFDITNACLGIVSGMQAADGLIKAGHSKYVLLVTAETMREYVDTMICDINNNRPDSIDNLLGMFTAGDAAGAMLIGLSSDNKGIEFINTGTKNKYVELCYLREQQGEVDFSMEMSRISAVTLRLCKEMLPETLDKLQWTKGDIDLLLTHQVGELPYTKLLDIFETHSDKSIKTYSDLGNITSCTIPVCWDMAQEQGLIKPNQKIMLVASGSGIGVSHVGITT